MRRRFFILCAAVFFLLLTGCQLQDAYIGMLVLGGSHTIPAGETLQGELVVLGGQVVLQPGSQVTGSIHILDGSVRSDGDIDGDVMIIAGQLQLGPRAMVHGNLSQVGGELTIAPGAGVTGQLNRRTASQAQPSPFESQAGRWITFALELPVLSALAFLTARFLPGPLQNIGQAATRYILPSAALGLLAWVVGLSLLLLMAYTILLIPLTILGFFSMLLATSYGVVPYGLWLGRWMSRRLGWKISMPVQATLGMVVFVCLVELIRFLPDLGGILPILLFISGFGAVLLTRFGFRRYVPPNLGES